MPTLAEQLRDALADYRKADDRGDSDLRAAALDRMQRLHERIKAQTKR